MTRGVVRVPGGELAWVAEGAGRPVVLLHAGFMDASSWAAAAAALAPGHAVVRYDARGHGASSVPTAPYAHFEDLRAVLDALGLPRAVRAGVSLGARTALDLALVAPERVEGLFLVSPGLSGMTFHDPFVLQQVQGILRAAAAPDGAAVVEGVLGTWVDGPHRTPAEVDAAVRARAAALAAANLAKQAAAAAVPVREAGAVDRLPELRVPVRVLVGALDAADILAAGRRLAGEVPGARLEVVPGAGHMVDQERPEAVLRALRDFLGGLPAAPALA